MSKVPSSVLIILLIVLGIVSQSVRVIPAGRTGVIFNLKGGVQDNALDEGLHFLIPFVQSLIIFDTRVTTYSFSNNPNESRQILGQPVVAKTRDGQIVDIEMSLVTQMEKSKAPDVYQKLRTDYESVLKAKTGKVMQEVIARHVADALYTEETRKIVTAEAEKYLAESFAASGFKLYDVFLRKIEFSKEYIEAIERKQIALQKAELAKILKEIAIKDKQIEILKGEAEAKVVEIKGKAIQANPSVAELEYLEAVEKSEEKIPVIFGLKGNSLLSIDQILKN